MPCASRSHPLAIAIAISMTRPGPRPTRPPLLHLQSPATSRSQFQFECCKRTPVKLIRFRFICKKTSLGGRKQKRKKKHRLIFRGGFVRNLRTMLCTPLREREREREKGEQREKGLKRPRVHHVCSQPLHWSERSLPGRMKFVSRTTPYPPLHAGARPK